MGGGRADHAAGALDIFGTVADMDFDALGDQFIRGDGCIHI